MAIRGLDKVNANLNREIRQIRGRSQAGLDEAAAYLIHDMDRTPPTIPVDTSNLRESWFTKRLRSLFGRGLRIGFSVNYAAAVHEMIDKKTNWNKPGSGAKFLEKALNRNHKKILQLIHKHAKIK